MYKKYDKVEFQREMSVHHKCNDIKQVLKDASQRYKKIQADLEIIESDYAVIVNHIKSYDGWEYFVDEFHKPAEGCVSRMYNLFNAVRVVGDIVELKYEPNHERFDGNNYTYGTCSFDDILNIEKIIVDRKRYYAENVEQL